MKAKYWKKKGNIGVVSKTLSAKKDGKGFRAEELEIIFQSYPISPYGPEGGNSTLVSI